MVIVKIFGGLGNQMFQYAIGRSLAIQNGTVLKLDLSAYKYFNAYIPRKFGLNVFQINVEEASEDECNKFKKGKVMTFLERIKPFYRRSTLREPYYNFSADVFKAKGEVCLDGYWQSEKYFSKFIEVIRNDFTLKPGFSQFDENLVKKIDGTNSVSVHVRRGDYVENETVNKIHGLCDPGYYLRALEVIKEKTGPITVFVFSDDIEWVKNNIKFDVQTEYVSRNGLEDYEEMILMSKCKHNVVANSSFSWWGAWLNRNANKIVIAPKVWFRDGKNTDDLIPENWIRL